MAQASQHHPMKVVLCDDHQLFMEALLVVLEEKGYQGVCTTDPQAALDVVRRGGVYLCLLDLYFPTGTVIATIAEITAASPGTHIVVLSGSTDLSLLNQALEAGAHGVAAKGEHLESIFHVIDRVRNGETVVQASLLRNGTRVLASPISAHPLARFLTARECEVLERLVLGQATAEIAAKMGVRYSTVRTHIQSILTKLGVHSKLEAVAFAMHEGLVSIAPESPGMAKPVDSVVRLA